MIVLIKLISNMLKYKKKLLYILYNDCKKHF